MRGRVRLYSSLQELHSAIDDCRVCDDLAPLLKPKTMLRGGMAPVMIVGEGPGKSEVASGRAFSGKSGKTLDRWLVSCGASPTTPRKNLYLTGVVKCLCSTEAPAAQMTLRCADFLRAQVTLLKPQLVITLGLRAYSAFQFTRDPYSTAIGRTFDSTEHVLFTRFDHHFTMLVWPHPSGLNRQLNDKKVLASLHRSFPVVRRYIAEAA